MFKTSMLQFQRWQQIKTVVAWRRPVNWDQPSDHLRYFMQKPLCQVSKG